MLRCVSLRVLAASCSLPPSGGRPRAAARCAALRRGRGLFAVLRPLRRPRVPFRGGALPPAPLPRRRAAARAPPRAAALRSGRGRPRAARARLCSCPLRGLRPPLWSLRSLRGVLAPLLPRRAAAFGGVAVRPRGVGAVPPSAPSSRVSPPSGASPRRFRSASPVACRRRAASARVAPAVPARRCGGLRRSGGRGGAFGGRCGGRLLWRFAPPRVGFGVCAAAALFSRLLRRAASPALLVCLAFGCGLLRALLRAPPAVIWLRPALLVRLAFGCGFRRALTAALKPRGLFAPSAHLLFKAKIGCKAQPQAQHIVPTIHLIYHIQASSAKLELFCRIICGFRQ